MKKPASILIALAVVVSSPLSHAGGIDRNGNGLNDIWEAIYHAQGLVANVDTDGDGYSNAQESDAGTNPFDPNSHPGLLLSPDSPQSLVLSWDSVAGKRYTLQSRTDLSGSTWTNEFQVTADAALSGTNIAVTPNSKFFRIGVSDTDSDADGLTDFEERALGFNPLGDHSGHNDLTDRQRATNGLSAASVITVATLDPDMSERWPDPGVVVIRRTNGILPLTVNLSFGGTAALGVDYLPNVTNTITIPLGIRELWVKCVPIPDANDAEPTETISVQVLPGTGYSVGASNIAQLTLANEPTNSLPGAKAAARFLLQAAFGPDQSQPGDSNGIPQNVRDVMALGFDGWLNDQFTRPVGLIEPWVDWASTNADAIGLYGNWKEFSWWNRAMGVPKLRPDDVATVPPDPLRQRVAFALSEILVVGDRPEQLAVEQPGMANYYDVLEKNAFGNFRNLLYDVARHPAMGIFLSHLGNQKADPANNIFPDENFAREVMQLFSIGLWQLNPDGTRKLDNQGQPIPTYNNGDITELARVFTGLSFGNNVNFDLYPRNFTQPMKMWDAYHDCNAKTLINGLQLPARIASPGNTGTAGLADVDLAVSNLFAHPNVGPFIGRQLIQRLITSNPGTNYIARVSAAFADNGSGVRGDMKAVIKAILLDPEARDPQMRDQPTWGKLREPFLRVVNVAHAFNATSLSGWYPVDQFALAHAEDPMNSPSVFNFFLPGYSPPGPITEQGLVAPEFQIINAGTAISGPNYFWDHTLSDLQYWGAGNTNYAVRLNLTNELGLICSPAQISQDTPPGPAQDSMALLRRLDFALTGGTLSPEQFQIIRESIERISPGTWQWHKERLRLAIYLITTSPDFNVLR